MQLSQRSDLDAVIFNGGTGIAPRDTTYDAIESLLEKPCGIWELFRWLSYQEIGSRASRAIAGVYQGKLVFSRFNNNAVHWLCNNDLPELVHLVSQLVQTGELGVSPQPKT